MYLDTLVFILFVGYLLFQYWRTKAAGNLGLLVPMALILVLNTEWVNTWPDLVYTGYRICIVATIIWAFWFYVHDFRKTAQKQAEQEKEAKAEEKAERRAKQKEANKHPNPSKKKNRR